MNWLKENWFKIIIAGIVGICLVYYFVILPNQKFQYQVSQDLEQKQEKEKQTKDEAAKKETNDKLRTFCLSLAQSSYMSRVKLNATSKDDFETWRWDSESSRAYVEGQLQNDKNECYKQYPVNN